MEFSKENLIHLEKLARVNLEEDQWQRCKGAFENALAMAETLKEVDTTGVAPTISPLDLVNVLREDQVRPGLDRETALSLAQETEGGCYKVPRIL